jgi:hypothetical protein
VDHKPEDYREAAEEALEQAKTLLGMGTMSDREFLESMARSDRFIEGENDSGFNAKILIEAQTARDLLAEGEVLDGIAKWTAEATRRWRQTKYFLLYQAEKEAGRDPAKAFEERGWGM